MRDFIYAVVSMILIAASFYAFQIIVLLIVGYVIYLCLPLLRKHDPNLRRRR